jgi:hypothetical protein
VHRPILLRIAGRGFDWIFGGLRVCDGRLARLSRLRVRRRNRFFCHAWATAKGLFVFPVLASSPAVGRSLGRATKPLSAANAERFAAERTPNYRRCGLSRTHFADRLEIQSQAS